MSKKKIVLIVAAVIALFTLLNSCVIIKSGHTGVVTQFGAVKGETLQEGLSFIVPFVQDVREMDNRIVRVDVASSSASKDLQVVTTNSSINLRVDKAKSAIIYQNVGKDYIEIIAKPAVQECVKAVTAKYTAEQLITERQMVGEQMKQLLKDKIEPYGLYIENFNILDFNFSEEFNKAIEAKQTAQQNALKAEQELNKIKIDAQQKVVQAEADAKAIRAVQDALNTSPQYIEYQKIVKWNGVLPQVTGSGGTIIDLTK